MNKTRPLTSRTLLGQYTGKKVSIISATVGVGLPKLPENHREGLSVQILKSQEKLPGGSNI